MLPIHLWMLHSDWGEGANTLWPDPIAVLYVCAYILYSLCIYCITNCSFSMHLHIFQLCIYKKHENYFKGLVIILITWCPPIGWCPRSLAQSRLWIIWCCAQFWPLPNYHVPSIGRFRVRCGGGVRIRQLDSDFNERGNNLAGGWKWAQHRPCLCQEAVLAKAGTYVSN